MRKYSIVSLVLSLSLIPLVSITGCGKGGGAGGNLPVLQTGDKWVYTTSLIAPERPTTTANLIMEVTGGDTVNGTDCYVITMSTATDSNYITPFNQTYFDKANLWIVRMQTVSTPGSMSAADAVQTTTLEFPEAFPWPFETGKEFKVVETSTLVVDDKGETETYDYKEISTWKVEKIEDIEVPAGNFKCFKINIYSENGTNTETRWYSDSVRFFVKSSSISGDIRSIMELKSFQAKGG